MIAAASLYLWMRFHLPHGTRYYFTEKPPATRFVIENWTSGRFRVDRECCCCRCKP